MTSTPLHCTKLGSFDIGSASLTFDYFTAIKDSNSAFLLLMRKISLKKKWCLHKLTGYSTTQSLKLSSIIYIFHVTHLIVSGKIYR